jgi:hypothetical protein
VAFDGKHKIANKWEEEPHMIVSQPNRDISVYLFQGEKREGRKRTLYRNLLLKIGFLPEDENSMYTIITERRWFLSIIYLS